MNDNETVSTIWRDRPPIVAKPAEDEPNPPESDLSSRLTEQQRVKRYRQVGCYNCRCAPVAPRSNRTKTFSRTTNRIEPRRTRAIIRSDPSTSHLKSVEAFVFSEYSTRSRLAPPSGSCMPEGGCPPNEVGLVTGRADRNDRLSGREASTIGHGCERLWAQSLRQMGRPHEFAPLR